MSESDFDYDVFLSHSAKDKAVVRDVAERLRKDGVKVWFDEWALKPGDSIPAKIEEGLERSRMLVLCMSANAFGSDWAQLESGTFRFRDPLNKERRFLPLRLDDAPIKGSLAQFLYINWLPAEREEEYAKLLDACRSTAEPAFEKAPEEGEEEAEKTIQLALDGRAKNIAFSSDGRKLATISEDGTLGIWETDNGTRMGGLGKYSEHVYRIALNSDGSLALTGSSDRTMRLWKLGSQKCLRVFEGHSGGVNCVDFSSDGFKAISCSDDKTLRLWDINTGRCLRVYEGHTARACL